MRTLLRLAVASLCCILLQACSSTPEYNATVFPYELNEELLAASTIRTVVIPHVNLGAPSRNYLAKEAPRIDAKVEAYLEENGFKVIDQRIFKRHWNTAERAYGNPVDPTSGKVNMKTFSQIMQSVRDQMRKADKLDAFVFTDLVELEVVFGGGLKHIARWDGVSRTPPLQGPGSGVTADFDWNAGVAAASLMVSIYNMDLQRLFISRGGLDPTDAIDTRSAGGSWKRRRNMLENEANLREGIELALHPFIEMNNYPGKQ
jgi:hypothetical protein